jgi:hypothetical protein
MERSLHERIILELSNITDDKVLIIGCNTIDERSAINRMAYYRGYSTKAINYEKRTENFIYYDKNEYQFSSGVYWSHPNEHIRTSTFGKEDYFGSFIIYHNDKDDRLEYLSSEDKIVNLDYNAVVIYPNYMKLTYKHLNDFRLRKNIVSNYGKKSHNLRKIKGVNIITKMEEIYYINNISYPIIKNIIINKLFTGFNINKISLTKEICNIYLIKDILNQIYNIIHNLKVVY